jgi:hypothetical protein
LRVGLGSRLDSGDQIADACEAAELPAHRGCGFPGFLGLQGGLSRAQSKLADWIAVNVHDAPSFELFPSFGLMNLAVSGQLEDQLWGSRDECFLRMMFGDFFSFEPGEM